MKSTHRIARYFAWGFIIVTLGLTLAVVLSPRKQKEILEPLTPTRYLAGTQVSGSGLGHVFKVRNNAREPLSVSLRKSCPCLAAEVNPNPIPARSEATVALKMFVPPEASGNQGAVCAVIGDRPDCKPVTFEIRGQYIAGLRAKPSPLLVKLSDVELDQTVYLHKNAELNIPTSSLRVEVKPSFIASTVQSGLNEWPVRVHLTGRVPDDAPEIMQGSVTITTQAETEDQKSELVVPMRLTRELDG
jgi:hypothetical protein